MDRPNYLLEPSHILLFALAEYRNTDMTDKKLAELLCKQLYIYGSAFEMPIRIDSKNETITYRHESDIYERGL